MRLDVYLCNNGYASSRTEAKGYIISGGVTINGKVITKPSYDVDNEIVEVCVDKSSKKYISRGGIKLEAALDSFSISVEGKRALDVGASSGGFTDCLLKRGASHVIAVDSGSGQLADALRNDSRVTSIENYNARFMTSADLEYIPEIVVMDVSFISATLIIPAIYNSMSEEGSFVCLVKPQFEVGRGGVGKGGIVKDDRLRRKALADVIEFATGCGFVALATMESPIQGGDGNTEFLVHFVKR